MSALSPDQTPHGWDIAAETYEWAFDSFTTQYAQEALRLTDLKAGWRILDVAAGCGGLAAVAARRKVEVVATDFSTAMVQRLRERIARESLPNVTATVMDGQNLEFPDNCFDAAYSVFGLIFFPDRARGLRELWRVLKPRGRAAVVAWSLPERMAVFPLVRRALQAAVPDFSPPAKPPSWQDLQDPTVFEAEMKAAGFREVRIHTVTREWTTPSAEWLWANLTGMSPAIFALFDKLGRDSVDAAGRVFVAELRRRFGDGPVRLSGEALIGVGAK